MTQWISLALTGLVMAGDLAGPAPSIDRRPADAAPRLPDEFRRLEWTRPDGSTLVAFANRVEAGAAKRPLLLFLDDAGAQSQFARAGRQVGCTLWGLAAQTAGSRYVVATLEKRGVEFLRDKHPGTAEGASEEYLMHATLEDRAADARLALDGLLADAGVDASRVLIVGHGEGAAIAAAVAADEPRVTHVAFLAGGGPTLFFDLIAARRRKLVGEGRSPEEIESQVAELERQINGLLTEPGDGDTLLLGHPRRRWASYGRNPPVEALRKSRCKLFLAHGTEDATTPIESFDLLTVELLRSVRGDMTVRRYVRCDHTFMRVGARPTLHLNQVLRDVINWAEAEGPAAPRTTDSTSPASAG